MALKKKEVKFEGNIVLVGFMGCGKSTTGIILAKRLGLNYVDTDRYLEQQHNKPVCDLFEENGEEGFRELEHHAVLDLCEQTGCVISTGGGVILRDDNLPPLKENGTVVYINTPFSLCYQRIASSDRPLVVGSSREELHDLYKLRRTIYRSVSDIEVPGISGSRPVVRAILAGLGLNHK